MSKISFNACVLIASQKPDEEDHQNNKEGKYLMLIISGICFYWRKGRNSKTGWTSRPWSPDRQECARLCCKKPRKQSPTPRTNKSSRMSRRQKNMQISEPTGTLPFSRRPVYVHAWRRSICRATTRKCSWSNLLGKAKVARYIWVFVRNS